MRTERVTFEADGVRLVGDLHLPDADGPTAGLALTGPFTGVKEQVVGTYAAPAAASAGYVTLAFDHRDFGESGGRRGSTRTPQGKLADLRAAVGYLAGRPEVDGDRIGRLGVCLGGGYAVRAAAFDPRVRRSRASAGAYNSPPPARARSDGHRELLRRPGRVSIGGRRRPHVPAVAADGPARDGRPRNRWSTTAPSAPPAPNWVNEVTAASLYSLMTLDVLSAADLLDADAAPRRPRHARRLLQPGRRPGARRPGRRARRRWSGSRPRTTSSSTTRSRTSTRALEKLVALLPGAG